MSPKTFFIPCTITEKAFRDFAKFNSFLFANRWVTLCLFPIVMIGLALLNLFTDSALLFWILLISGIVLPALYLLRFKISLDNQVKANDLSTPRIAYSISIDKNGIIVENGEEKQPIGWEKVYRAFRTEKYIYLYATKKHAFILTLNSIAPSEQDALWNLFLDKMQKGRAIRKNKA